MLVSIDGNIKTESWEKEGQKHSKQVVNCEKIVFASENNNNQQSNQYQKNKHSNKEINNIHNLFQTHGESQAQNNKSFAQQQNDDDIPF